MEKDEKAKLYSLIVRRTSDQVMLERMRLHGFWPQGEGLPQDPPAEAEERAHIEQEIEALRRTHSQVKNPAQALAEERKRRWAESKKRRAAAKQKRAAEQEARRQEWQAFRQDHLVHAGEGVSAGLQGTETDLAALQEKGLPLLHEARDVAALLDISLQSLRWLTFHRRGATLVHYHRFEIPKKTGGRRHISAPKPLLAKAQHGILEQILDRLHPDVAAHGFVARHSIVSNAGSHVGRRVVVNLDLSDFFPSITFRRVQGLFRRLGYSTQVATVLALLCTEPPRLPTSLDGKIYYVALGERVLPQGACTSPALTNAICRRLDRRLAGLARRHGFQYTRYADDLTFSGDRPKAVGRLLRSVRDILSQEGLRENAAKTRVMRRSRRQEVTGVTVNERVNLSRKERRLLRAILHNVARDGLAHHNRGDHPDFAAHLRGKVAFAAMVSPPSAPALLAALDRALHRR